VRFTYLHDSPGVSVATIAQTLRDWVAGGAPQPDLQVMWTVGRDPGTIVADGARPIRILFHRPADNPACQMVHFLDFGIVAGLTPHGTTLVDLGPRRPGRYKFCAPDEPELHGWLVVR
jgi:plastocyanin domain-containing protein